MDIQTKDGILLRGIPDGTPDDVIKARIEKIRGEKVDGPGSPEKIASAQKRVDDNLAIKSPTTAEIVAANPATRALTGAGSLLYGPLQLGANAGDKIAEAMGNEPVVGKWLNKNIDQLKEMQRAGGHEGFDWAGLLGNLAGGASALKNLPVMATAAGKSLQGAGIGAGFGAATPVEGGNDGFWGNKATQTGAGAAVGAAAPPIIHGIGKGVRGVKQALYPSPNYLARTAAGDRVDDVIDALVKSKSGVPGYQQTAGEAAAPAGSAEFSALQKLVSSRDPSKFTALKEINDSALRADLSRVASGNTQEAAIAAQKAAKDALKQTVVPKMEAELAAANEGLPPLNTTALVGALKQKLKDPSIGVSDINKSVITSVGKKIAEWTKRNGGVIDAKALHEIRKTTVNEQVEKLLGGADPKASARRAASILGEVKPLIDDAIEAAGGSGWRKSLDEFSQGMHLIDRQKMGAKALGLLDVSPKRLVRLGEGNAPKIVSKVFGPGRDSLVNEMGPDADVIRRVSEEVANNMRFTDLAKAGGASLENRIGGPVIPPTGFFAPMVSAARSWGNKMIGTGLEKGLDRLDPLMSNPQELARIMQKSTPQQRAVIEAMLTRAGIIGSTQAMGQ